VSNLPKTTVIGESLAQCVAWSRFTGQDQQYLYLMELATVIASVLISLLLMFLGLFLGSSVPSPAEPGEHWWSRPRPAPDAPTVKAADA
jgi:lipopolysaccharide export LptBFGC system permease protein LptF